MVEFMKAAVLHGPEDLRIATVPRPVPGDDEVLLKITSAGVCGSDAKMYQLGAEFIPGPHQPGPRILGHEFAGVVVDAGKDVDPSLLGKLVACGAGISCGHCRPCTAGRTNLCLNYSTAGVHRDGGLAEYCAVPVAVCEETSQHGVSGDDAGLAQPMAVAHHCSQRGRIRPGEKVLILGVGGIGMFLAYIATNIGADVVVVDLDRSRLEIAAEWGAHAVLSEGEVSMVDLLSPLGPFDVIFEGTGAAGPLAAALDLANRGTRVVLIGLQAAPRTIDLIHAVVEETEIIGTTAHVRREDLPSALSILGGQEAGWARLAPLVIPLEDLIDDALRPLARGQSANVKSLIDPRIDAARKYGRG